MRFIFFSKDSVIAQELLNGLNVLDEMSSQNCTKKSSGVFTFWNPLGYAVVVDDHLFFMRDFVTVDCRFSEQT